MEGVRAYEGRFRRQQILTIALQLFLKRGFERTTMGAIAEEVKISKAGLYHYFKSKDDLLTTLYLPSFQKVEDLVKSSPSREELLQGYMDIMLEDRQLTTLIANDLSILSEPKIGSKAVELMELLQLQLAGEEPSLEEKMRAECALGVLRSAVTAFPGADDEIIRSVGIRSAKAVLFS